MRSKFKWILTLLVAFSMQFSFAQEKTITGTVSDASGPMPGVNVVVKGSQRGASTNFDGSYSIKAKVGETLVYSFMGLDDASRIVGADNVINVLLQEVAKELDFVVISNVKKRKNDVPTSVTTIKTAELTQAAASNVVQGLIGKVSGVQINTTSGGVNSTTRIVINGTRSITGNNQALVVIDNVISSAGVLQSLPPEIIESLTVIKGAQGAALYGEQGVNGVIVVNTIKGGKNDKLTVSFTSALDFQEVAYLPLRQTRYGQGWFGHHISVENGGWGALNDGSLQATGLPQEDGSTFVTPYTGDSDNIKKFFNTGTILQNGLSISGGTADSGYFLFSVNRQDRQFVVKGDELKRTNFLFKAGKKIGKLTVEGNVQYFSQNTDNTANTTNLTGVTSLYGQLLQTATNIPVELFENSGNNGHWTVYTRNPYWTRDNNRESSDNNFFSGISNLKYDFNKNISASWVANVQTTSGSLSRHNNAFTAKEDIYSEDFGVRLQRSNLLERTSLNRNFYSDIVLNFNYELAKDLNMSAALGNNIQDRYGKINTVGGNDLNIPGYYNYQNVLLPTPARLLDNTIARSRRAAIFANIDLNYKDIVALNVTGRNDWSSTLSPENNSFFYPGVGLSLFPLKAFEGLKGKVLNFAKLYASWTKVGNSSAVGAYDINEIGTIPGGFPFGTLSAFQINQDPTDKNIKPEFNTTKDFGLSLGFFNDRVTFDGQYFITDTDDLITRSTTSSTSGLSSALKNIGQLQTTGFNIDLGFVPIKTESFRWDAKINYSAAKTIINKVTDSSDEVSLQEDGGGLWGIFATKGEEFPLIKGIGYERDPLGRIIIDQTSGNPIYTTKFKTLGKATPDYILGFTNSFSYKGLKFTAVCDYRTGHQFFSEAREQLAWTGNLIDSAINGRTGGFIMPNTVYEATPGSGVYTPNTNVVSGGNTYTTYQTLFGNDQANSNAENNVLDATAFKVRELALNYAIPQKLFQNTGISSLTIGVNAKNVLMFLPKANKYYSDPEASNAPGNITGNGLTSPGVTSSNAQGVANIGQYPFTRSFGFALNLTF